MAQYGEWNQKGATLSDVTAEAEYGVSYDFIVKGINAGKLEYRDGAIWGNPYLRILRSQLEAYISEEHGSEFLARVKNEAELKVLKKQVSATRKKLKALELRQKELEVALNR